MSLPATAGAVAKCTALQNTAEVAAVSAARDAAAEARIVQSARKDVEARLKEVTADWGMLEVAFSDDTAGVRWYLHVQTGALMRIQEDDLAPSTPAGDSLYLFIERARSREQYRWMERFVASLTDRAFAAKLAQAIHGRQAFQRFRAALGEHPGAIREWFDFRANQLAEHIHSWFAAHGLVLVPPGPASGEVEQVPASSKREAEARLAVAVTDLETDDLEALVALADFLYLSRAPLGGPR